MKGWGTLLRHWRSLRGMSQSDLAAEAEISTRHLSFLETGRANPSAEMVGLLCSALRVPSRDRDALLLAAGFAPLRRRVDLEDPAMAEARRALQLILRRQEPFAAVVVDGRWDIVMVNDAFARFLATLDCKVPAFSVTSAPRVNWLRLLFAAGKVRRVIVNWDEVAAAVAARVARDDPELARELVGGAQLPAGAGVLIPVRLRLGEREARFISTVSSLGTALDPALQDFKIDAFHPFDDEPSLATNAAAKIPTAE
jgi:transcriptional regulator with XRE-family HTH domain